MKLVDINGLEVMLYFIDPTNSLSLEKSEEMEKYAMELGQFAVSNKIKPLIISMYPDHEKLVIELKPNNNMDTLLEKFEQSEHYKIVPYSMDPRIKQVFYDDEVFSKYAVEILNNRVFKPTA